ncbi:glycoside hydrolase family 16 protein [Enterococcus thailandicus]|uniref:glycoside hydrolase family 16 protein n=1 Tax=Enterococcus thailandicus TaxID=417368 RepID=UPI0022EBF15D|nr:glycoside hydrolase family 16 protein [Enterococcus thailandicus]MDA3974073.1 glycoside hydrolase family 16 protein [Enterococcus thailandicus]MDA3976765.1 glycoside hydrolase family 16 protein [Enterococcus thailandicus]MDA3981527.1 glycoside hydrolase family 16 protein [Enterococcus thailandicus]
MKKLFCVLAVVSVGLSLEKMVAAEEQIPEKNGYTLDFHDEFNGPTLDQSKWSDKYLAHWADNPDDAKANYRFEEGKLIESIQPDQKAWAPTLDKDNYGYGTTGVKSSAIQSFNKNWIHNFSGSKKLMSPISPENEMLGDEKTGGYATTYGYFEIRAKLSNSSGGGHQAWWLVGMQNDTNDWGNSKETGEIDIIETFFDYSKNVQRPVGTKNVTEDNRQKGLWQVCTYGWNDPFFSRTWTDSTTATIGGAEAVVPGAVGVDSLTNEFHTYSMEWEPGSLKFYFDGQLFRTINQAPDYPMGMILNIYTDAGSGKHNEVYPKEWAIDYVRVYKKDAGYDIPKQGIKNRETGEFLSLATESDKVILSATNENLEKWQMIPKGEYFLIKNARTNELLHNEYQKGYVEHGVVPETYYSAQWKKETVGNYTRFVNRWKPTQVIHIENNLGYLECSPIHTGAWRSQWEMID